MTIQNKHYFSAFKLLCIGTALAAVIGLIVIFTGMLLYPSLDDLISCLLSEELRFAITLSIVTALISTFLCAIVAIPSAYSMTRFDFFGKEAANILLNLPLSLPPLVAGIALLIFFSPVLSPVGGLLAAMGINVVYTTTAIVIAQFFVNTPYMIRSLRSSFAMVNPRYEHTARTLGCSEWNTFVQVTLPMAKSGLIAGIVITWSKAMGEFGAVLMFAGAIAMKTETLPMALFINMTTGDIEKSVAAAIILLIISAVVLVAVEHWGKETGVEYV
ncbi:MAG: molybdate ABC transporter permease subunit [Methanomicrobium sp.]|nr:molybdate ABC transporter permease subunit [Methanomicrobium sp.]MBR6012026.1 molybdate ABC transporter permease subunit [Methanomicrobium sp.]MBR6447400.1 molybdate ABC transporter permease subunit [Methanomicrobium sp.]